MRRHLLGVIVAILAFTSMVFVYHKTRALAGAAEAYTDYLRGRYYIKAYRRLAAEKDKYNEVLKEFGVEIVALGDCDVTEDLEQEIFGYNSVSLWAIDKKYGQSIWQREREKLGPPDMEVERQKNLEFARRCESLKQRNLAE
jgi:hypothetical protein